MGDERRGHLSHSLWHFPHLMRRNNQRLTRAPSVLPPCRCRSFANLADIHLESLWSLNGKHRTRLGYQFRVVCFSRLALSLRELSGRGISAGRLRSAWIGKHTQKKQILFKRYIGDESPLTWSQSSLIWVGDAFIIPAANPQCINSDKYAIMKYKPRRWAVDGLTRVWLMGL